MQKKQYNSFEETKNLDWLDNHAKGTSLVASAQTRNLSKKEYDYAGDAYDGGQEYLPDDAH